MGCINELFVFLLKVGYLADALYGYVVFGGLKGVSGRGEDLDVQDRAVGPH